MSIKTDVIFLLKNKFSKKTTLGTNIIIIVL